MTGTLTRWLAAAMLLALALAAMAAAVTAGVLGQASADGCQAGQATSGTRTRGASAVPLHLLPGRWYQVGATEYGGAGDPTSGAFGSIPDPGESYLPSHPDTFAELSVLP